ncbi:MAG: hypothetical protein R3Y08_02170 [Rikenellaceae bacterium]
MKKFIISLILILSTFSLSAQLRAVHINFYGDLLLEVGLPRGGYLLLDQYGKVKQINAAGLNVTKHSNFHHYEAGKIKSINDLRFAYYSDFHDYESGKVKSIGDIKFKYHSAFHDYEAGKVEQIGNTKIEYYSDFHDCEAGKVKSIGGYKYSYDSDPKNGCYLSSGMLSVTVNGLKFNMLHTHRR